jgi:hypothetical protein
MKRDGTALATLSSLFPKENRMKKLAFAVPIAILAVLAAGCSSPGPDNPASASIKPIEHPYWTGTGVVQAVTPAPGPVAAGPSTATPSERIPAARDSGMQRLRIRMDDGRMMYVDTPSRDFLPGTRVQLSDGSEIRRQ